MTAVIDEETWARITARAEAKRRAAAKQKPATSPPAACPSCGYRGRGWRFEGIQRYPGENYDLWTCPGCGSTHCKPRQR